MQPVSTNQLIHYAMVGDDGLMHTLDGNPIAGFPDLLGNLRLTWRDSSWTGSFVVKYVGPFYTDNFKNAGEQKRRLHRLQRRTAVPASRFFRMSSLELRGEVRNLFNGSTR